MTFTLHPPPAQPTAPQVSPFPTATTQPEVQLWQLLIRSTDDHLSAIVFLNVARPPR
jgi:hypothetical protein